MRILGIHYGHDANACVIEDGRVLYAIGEERINRKKFYRGFPFLSIKAALEYTGLSTKDIDVVVLITTNTPDEELGGNLRSFYSDSNGKTPFIADVLSTPVSIIDNIFQLNIRKRLARNIVEQNVIKAGLDITKLVYVDHHLAHAAGAFFLSGFNESLVFTVDGKGDYVSHRTYIASKNTLKKLYESKDYHSAGHFYSCITSYLGFRRLHHEGKITGLAAYGDFDKVKQISSPLGLDEEQNVIKNKLLTKDSYSTFGIYMDMLKKDPKSLFRMLATTSSVRPWYGQYCYGKYFEDNFKGIEREHVATFAQRHLEDTILKLVQKQVKKNKIPNICMSGGVFGNVRLNQKIADLDGVKNVYIQPAMGDGGLSAGGALWEYYKDKDNWKPSFLENVYLGPEFSKEQIMAALKKYNVKYKLMDNTEKYIADALSNGKIVGRFKGRMEWGPRALGNRTIIAPVTDVSINDTLNKRLKRSDFMPFAPIILEEQAHAYFEGYKPQHLAPRFMTITYNVVEDKRSQIPAVVHVDGTARPQVVRKEDNPSLYKVLSEYYKLTAIPVLINTSFNMHEEPIVCTPDDAVRAYLQGAVDILAIEDFIVNDRILS